MTVTKRPSVLCPIDTEVNVSGKHFRLTFTNWDFLKAFHDGVVEEIARDPDAQPAAGIPNPGRAWETGIEARLAKLESAEAKPLLLTEDDLVKIVSQMAEPLARNAVEFAKINQRVEELGGFVEAQGMQIHRLSIAANVLPVDGSDFDDEDEDEPEPSPHTEPEARVQPLPEGWEIYRRTDYADASWGVGSGYQVKANKPLKISMREACEATLAICDATSLDHARLLLLHHLEHKGEAK